MKLTSSLQESIIPPLYEDNHLLVVNKPAGMLTQADHTGDLDLLSAGKTYIKEKYNKPGNVFLGLVHRLDRPVSGVIVLARTSKAAARLSKQIRERSVKKQYLALVEGKSPSGGNWIDMLKRKQQHSAVDLQGKEARLSFNRLDYQEGISLVRVNLITGLHHQIRVQFASRGFPLLGDFRYGSKNTFPNRALGLHAECYACEHPTTQKEMAFHAEIPNDWKVFAVCARGVDQQGR